MAHKKKDLLSLLALSSDEIIHILSMAAELKKQRCNAVEQQPFFKNKTGVMIFEKPSLRTRITFETAIYESGGHPIDLPAGTIGMGKRESVADIAKNLEKWVHLIIARTFQHNTLEKLAQNSAIPVVNALTDFYHPCQALAFAQTLFERGDKKDATSVVFVGDSNNVCNSIMILCAKVGINFTLVCPKQYYPKKSILDKCFETAKISGAQLAVTHTIEGAVQKATAIYTDVWASMGQECEAEKRKSIFLPYQVNEQVLAKAPKDVLVSHCLPAHRGEEITDAVLDSDNSIAFTEAENRLHVQKAVIAYLFS